jgi:sugar phosphate isomerase/epimerase
MYTDEYWGKSGPDTHINISDNRKADRIKWVDEIKRAIEISETVPFRYLIQHLGVNDQEFSERTLDAAFSSLDELGVFARQRGVEILLENIRNDLASAYRLHQFNELTHLDMNFVFDVGHAHIVNGIEAEFATMASKVRSLHVHDNDGTSDQHLYPMSEGGSIDWKNTMDLLRSRPGQYPLLLELREVPAMENPIEEAVRVFDKLEAL